MPSLLSLQVHCRPPAMHGQRNLPTTTTGSTSLSLPLANPPALACPHVPAAATHPLLIQPSPPSAAKQMGVKVPQRLRARASPLLCDKANAHPPWRKRKCQPKSCVPFWGWQPWGIVWQEQEKLLLGVLDAAGRSHSIFLWLCHRYHHP